MLISASNFASSYRLERLSEYLVLGKGLCFAEITGNRLGFLGHLIPPNLIKKGGDYSNEPKKFTIAIGLRLFQTQQSQHMAETMAMTLVATIPVLLVFYLAQARFIRGIVITGVKG